MLNTHNKSICYCWLLFAWHY